MLASSDFAADPFTGGLLRRNSYENIDWSVVRRVDAPATPHGCGDVVRHAFRASYISPALSTGFDNMSLKSDIFTVNFVLTMFRETFFQFWPGKT